MIAGFKESMRKLAEAPIFGANMTNIADIPRIPVEPGLLSRFLDWNKLRKATILQKEEKFLRTMMGQPEPFMPKGPVAEAAAGVTGSIGELGGRAWKTVGGPMKAGMMAAPVMLATILAIEALKRKRQSALGSGVTYRE